MKKVIITGISGTLGSALGKLYLNQGWEVIGVSRDSELDNGCFSRLCHNYQESSEDAQALLAYNPDLVILNAGQIETEIGVGGVPLKEQFNSITSINYLFPALFAIEAFNSKPESRLDIIAIGSIADGSPSCFGPVYHASKIALHYFFSGVGPIVNHAESKVRMRLYRPGAIKGALAWAPINRLNEKGYKIRKKRVDGAPEGDIVAKKIAKWIEGNSWIGTYEEPFSFKIFKYIFALAPNFFYRLQMFGWRKGSKFY